MPIQSTERVGRRCRLPVPGQACRAGLLARSGRRRPSASGRSSRRCLEADDRQRQQAGDDDEELQDLVVDRRGQPAERDVGEHDDRGDDDRTPSRPAEQRLDDQRQRVEVDAGDERPWRPRRCRALTRWVGGLKRRRRYSGTERTLEP